MTEKKKERNKQTKRSRKEEKVRQHTDEGKLHKTHN